MPRPASPAVAATNRVKLVSASVLYVYRHGIVGICALRLASGFVWHELRLWFCIFCFPGLRGVKTVVVTRRLLWRLWFGEAEIYGSLQLAKHGVVTD
jgi:hypothetical protein